MHRTQVLVSALVVVVLIGGAFYSSCSSEGSPRTVYSVSLEEIAAEAQAPAVIRVNTASSDELEELPGVGPATAEAIIEHRQARGAFRAFEELEEVPGIGPKTIENIRPFADL